MTKKGVGKEESKEGEGKRRTPPLSPFDNLFIYRTIHVISIILKNHQ